MLKLKMQRTLFLAQGNRMEREVGRGEREELEGMEDSMFNI